MESLGGDQLWVDRFMAQHAAIVYFIILVIMYVAAPKLAYNFSEVRPTTGGDSSIALRPPLPGRCDATHADRCPHPAQWWPPKCHSWLHEF